MLLLWGLEVGVVRPGDSPGTIIMMAMEESASLWLNTDISDDEDFRHTATREGNTFWKSIIMVHWFKLVNHLTEFLKEWLCYSYHDVQ